MTNYREPPESLLDLLYPPAFFLVCGFGLGLVCAWVFT